MSRLSTVLIVFALALVALGIYDITRGKPGEPGGSTPSSSAAPTPTAAPDAGGVELATADLAVGTVVTSDGVTLYRFDKDTAKPSKSTCNGPCAQTWPPLLATGGAPKVSGVDAGLVGTVTRDDGAQQVTLNGWPLYSFAKDEPGQAKGEGVGGTWHAIAPTGKPAAAGASAPGPGPAVAPTGAPAPSAAPRPSAVRQAPPPSSR
jgi:predicted lipoprotein with Yx(FWY)xxD motif